MNNLIKKYTVIFTALCLIAGFVSCETKPTAPAADNIFDEENPVTKGNAFKLVLTNTLTGVLLKWNIIPFDDILYYKIFRSEQKDSGYSKIDSVSKNTTSYKDLFVLNSHTYYYKLSAVSIYYQESSIDNIDPVSIYVEGMPNKEPYISFVAREDKNNPSIWHFDASGSWDYEDGKDLEYRWDLNGDGEWDDDWSKLDKTEYTYPVDGGDFTIKLAVRDKGYLSVERQKKLHILPVITDIDGNVYKIVKIGSQRWMANNLKVTHFRNGDAIDYISSYVEWIKYSSAAYCFYDSRLSFIADYGMLYNGYCVTDSRNIAPDGWHVPTDDDWKTLEKYLAMSHSVVDDFGWRGTTQGNELKESGTEHWLSSNNDATNSTWFSARPGGYRTSVSGEFSKIGEEGYWWTSTLYSSSYIIFRSLAGGRANIHRGTGDFRFGISIRCIKDQ